MDDAHVMHFVLALSAGDDIIALYKLENNLVAYDAFFHSESIGLSGSYSMLYLSIFFGREVVMRNLIRLGADIDELFTQGDGSFFSVTGVAIMAGNACKLSICHRLGASMAAVVKFGEIEYSAIECAFLRMSSDCLALLLDVIYPERPIKLTLKSTLLLSKRPAPSGLKSVIGIYEVLRSRGFDFKSFNHEITGGCTTSDRLVAMARYNEQPTLLLYLLKHIGLTSTRKAQDNYLKIFESTSESSKNGKETKSSHIDEEAEGSPTVAVAPHKNPVIMTKFECAACDLVTITKVCTGCRAVRYCSVDCSNRDWKSGGHKRVCTDVQRCDPQNASRVTRAAQS